MIEHIENKRKSFRSFEGPVGRADRPSGLSSRNQQFRVALILAVAAALAGCNTSQGVDPSPQAAPINTSGRFVSNYNPYNPITYAQTSGFYHGGR